MVSEFLELRELGIPQGKDDLSNYLHALAHILLQVLHLLYHLLRHLWGLSLLMIILFLLRLFIFLLLFFILQLWIFSGLRTVLLFLVFLQSIFNQRKLRYSRAWLLTFTLLLKVDLQILFLKTILCCSFLNLRRCLIIGSSHRIIILILVVTAFLLIILLLIKSLLKAHRLLLQLRSLYYLLGWLRLYLKALHLINALREYSSFSLPLINLLIDL